MSEPSLAPAPPDLPKLHGTVKRSVLHILRARQEGLKRRKDHFRHRVRLYKIDTLVGPGSYIAPGVTIGQRTRIPIASFIEPCEIGSYCALAGSLIVRSANHRMDLLGIEEDAQRRIIGAHSLIGPREKTSIGHSVWIGDRVVVCPGVHVGNGAVVGAGSVVTKSVPDYAIVAGAPARLIRYRYPEAIVELLKGFEWWFWDDDRLRRNRDLFEIDLTNIDPADLAERLRKAT